MEGGAAETPHRLVPYRPGCVLLRRQRADPFVFRVRRDPPQRGGAGGNGPDGHLVVLRPGVFRVHDGPERDADSPVDVPPPVQPPDPGPAHKGAGLGLCPAAGGPVLAGEKQEAGEAAPPGRGPAAHLWRHRPVRRGGGAEPVQLRRGLLRHVGSGNRGLHSVGVLHREAAVRCRAFSPALPEVNVM